MLFSELPLKADLLKGVEALGFTKPTPGLQLFITLNNLIIYNKSNPGNRHKLLYLALPIPLYFVVLTKEQIFTTNKYVLESGILKKRFLLEIC